MTEDQLSAIFNRVAERHSIIKDTEERTFKFMTENTFLEVHCIDFIEKITDPNVTKLTNALHVTRGAISKTTKKLLETENIERYQRPENKKEIYFKLTEKGKAIFDEHEKMHASRIMRDRILFKDLSEDEKQQLFQMLNKIYQNIIEELKRLGLENDI